MNASSPAPLLDRLFGMRGQVSAVTGAAGRIGRSVCQALAEAGSDLALLDIDTEAVEQLAAELRQHTGRRVLALRTDTTQADALADAVGSITAELGPPGVLVNLVQYRGGGFYSSAIDDYPREAWDRVLEANLTGVFLACQAFGRSMTRHRGGKMVLVSSTYGLVSADPRIYGSSGVNSPVAYAASKSGVINLTRYLAVHWREQNIRVNCLVPGGVLDGQDEHFVEQYCRRTPLGRMARAEDYQGPVLFMVSEASAYMTGSVVTVDGGWTAW